MGAWKGEKELLPTAREAAETEKETEKDRLSREFCLAEDAPPAAQKTAEEQFPMEAAEQTKEHHLANTLPSCQDANKRKKKKKKAKNEDVGEGHSSEGEASIRKAQELPAEEGAQ